MEKIYIEKDKKEKRRKKLNTSIVLSFVVAFFAIATFATFGIVQNQGTILSYAAPAGDSFTLHIGEESGEEVWALINDGTATGSLRIPMHCTDESCTNFAFCYEKNNVEMGTEYTKEAAVTNAGLIYLLNKIENTKIRDEKYVDHWEKQIMIWLYMDEAGLSSEGNRITTEELDALKAARTLKVTNLEDYDENITIGDTYNEHIRKWVDEAKAKNSAKYIELKTANPIPVKQTEDKKYYYTDKIEVTGESLATYEVTLEKIDGAFISEDTKCSKKLEGKIAKNKVFYACIPTDKVTGEVQDLNVKVKGNYDLKGASIYKSGEKQRLLTLNGDITHSTSLIVRFTGTPSTGLSVGQTVYFVGLIVLLCGVGIIYANAKPIEKEQQ